VGEIVCVVAPVFHKNVAPAFPAFKVIGCPEQSEVSLPKLTTGNGIIVILILSVAEQITELVTVTE
jgi:hypothetical protein